MDSCTKQRNLTRITELDWMRVCALGLLIFYHTGMIYTEDWGFHYKSPYQFNGLDNIMLWCNQWRMPLLFVIAGAACYQACLYRPPWLFLRSRYKQILTPLVFGVLVVVVPQVYVEALQINLIQDMSFWTFWLHYLDQNSSLFQYHKTLGSLHFTWNHLWFLPYLLCYSTLLAVVMSRFRKASPPSQPFRYSLVGVLLVTLVILHLCGALLYDKFPSTQNFVYDWYNHSKYFTYFLLGALCIKQTHLWQQFKLLRWWALGTGITTYSLILHLFHGGQFGDGGVAQQMEGLVWNANGLTWAVCVIGWFQQLSFPKGRLLNSLNRGVFCFYITHQTALIVLAAWLQTYHLGPFVEPLLVIFGTFAMCYLVFELTKHTRITCRLMGISPINNGHFTSNRLRHTIL